MADVFISYSRKDHDWVARLAHSISSKEYSVWWDIDIPPGEFFDNHIENQIIAAKCIIVVWSKASISSRWVKAEASEGLDRNILVPVLMQKVNPPLAFRSIQTADLSDWDGHDVHANLDKVCQRVVYLVGKQEKDSVEAKPSNIGSLYESDRQLKEVSINLKINKIYNDKAIDYNLKVDDAEFWEGSLISHDGLIYTALLEDGKHNITFFSSRSEGRVTKTFKIRDNQQVNIHIQKSWWDGAEQIEFEVA